MTDSELLTYFNERKQELELRENHLENLQRLQEKGGVTKSSLAMEISRVKSVGKDLESDVRSKQQQLLHINESHNKSLEGLAKTSAEVCDIMQKNYSHSGSRPSNST